MQVYDKDRVVSDDFMGMTELDISSFELEMKHGVVLNLEHGDDPFLIRQGKEQLCKQKQVFYIHRKLRKKGTLGSIVVRFTLSPLSEREYNKVCLHVD